MLNELTGLQSSDEDVYSDPKVSFEIETKESGGEDIRRRYVFSQAPEWDKWMFHEFEEKRDGRRSRHVFWDDAKASSIEIPPEVTKKLEELLDLEKVVLQTG